MTMKSRVDVDVLAAHIREEVRRHRDGLPASATEPAAPPAEPLVTAAPTLTGPDGAVASVDTLSKQADHLIAQAELKIKVGDGVPKLLRPLWRNQGGYNGALLRTVETLRDANRVLAAENLRLRGHSDLQAEWMNRLAQGVEQLQARLASLERQNDFDQQWFRKLQIHAEEQAAEIETLHERANAQAHHLQHGLDRLTEQQQRIDRSLSRLDDRQMTDASFLKQQLWLQQRRPGASLDGKKELPADRLPVRAAEQGGDGSAHPEADRDLDALYVAFENVFRGTRQDIKQRLEFYLPYLHQARPGGADKTVLDLGCGRGEWLELLGEHGFTAAGVDLNACMVEECRQRGLPAHLANALEHLAALPAESVGAVSAFHLIEHLPSARLLQFFRECRRVLQPGGVAIFETPNPYNLVVGAAQFYDDHTHQRPLPPNSTRFLVEQAGFARADILPLHPRAEADKVHGDGTNPELVERFNELFYGPQDYAIVALVSL